MSPLDCVRHMWLSFCAVITLIIHANGCSGGDGGWCTHVASAEQLRSELEMMLGSHFSCQLDALRPQARRHHHPSPFAELSFSFSPAHVCRSGKLRASICTAVVWLLKASARTLKKARPKSLEAFLILPSWRTSVFITFHEEHTLSLRHECQDATLPPSPHEWLHV